MSDNENSDREFEMPRRFYAIEFWVGLFTLIGLACFSYLAINVAGMKLFNTGVYSVKARFTNVAGLKVGAPVEIAGVQVGEVAGIELKATEAVITMEIRQEVELREDDIAQVRTKGIIGDKYIKISPGGSEDLLENGALMVDTESAVELEEVLGKFIHSLDKK